MIEFVLASTNRKNLICKEKLEAVFKMFDTDQSGHLDTEELKGIFSGFGVPSEAWAEIITEVDEDGDGQVSFHEFQKMMIKLLSKEEKVNARSASAFSQTLFSQTFNHEYEQMGGGGGGANN